LLGGTLRLKAQNTLVIVYFIHVSVKRCMF
jgi:hypothetical protein